MNDSNPEISKTPTLEQSDHINTDAVKQESSPMPEREEELNLVTWKGSSDPKNPQNWSLPRKLLITGIWVYGCITTSVASSLFSSAAAEVGKEFSANTTVVTLGISLFLLGYAVGPTVFGPMSERYGRKWPMFIGMLLFTIFCIPAAVGQNLETILVARFLAGTFGSAPLSLAGGGMVDIWSPIQRGVALAACIGTIFGMPLLAPVIGNFITASYLGWRWTQWISCIMGGSCALMALFLLPETFGPAILRRRAAELRKTVNPDAKTAFDGPAKGIMATVKIYLIRPFVLLATEPILDLITIYQAFIFGILYLFFVSYPIAFRELRHWDFGVSALPFLGMMVGVMFGGITVVWHTKTWFLARVQANNGKVVPEDRLVVMIWGGCMLPVGLFIVAWTSDPNIHWAGTVIGSIPVGMGMFMVFVQCFVYLVDVYPQIANSAVAANTLVRSLFGACFPLFGPFMYHSLGVPWATSVLGFVSVAMIPIPILFYRYGHRIRSWSKRSARV